MSEPNSGPPIALADSAVAVLVENEGAAQDRISDNLVAVLAAMWAGFSAFYAGEAVALFGARAARLVLAAQRAAGTITESHLRQQMQRMDYRLPATRIVDLPRDLRLGAETADVYQRPVRQVRYLVSTGIPEDEAAQTAGERLEKLALTDLQLARSTAAQQVQYATDERVTGYRRVIHPELGNVCGLCIAAADRVYSKRELLPLHPGCVVEGTEVSAEGVRALTRRRYAGRLVILRTRSGQELCITPNHPVLTDQGWVPADFLQVGDRVVGDGREYRDGGRRPDEQQRPVRVEDLWRSVTVAGGLLPSSVPLASEDFHGEGGDAEVDVVLVDRHLGNVGDVSFSEPCRELRFMDAHGWRARLATERTLELFRLGFDAAFSGDMGRASQIKTILSRRLAVAHRGPADPSSGGHVGFSQSKFNDRSGYVELSGKLWSGGPFQISANDGVAVHRDAPTSRFDPAGFEFAGDGRRAYAVLGGKLLQRLAGDVLLDEVIDKTVIEGSHWVFNLETEEGWYRASSIAVSNCKCTTIPVIGEKDPGGQLNADDLALIYAAAGGTTDSRALSKTRFEIRQNGELGPILVPVKTNPRGPEAVKEQLSDRAASMRKVQLERQIAELAARTNRSAWHQDRMERLQELLDAA